MVVGSDRVAVAARDGEAWARKDSVPAHTGSPVPDGGMDWVCEDEGLAPIHMDSRVLDGRREPGAGSDEEREKVGRAPGGKQARVSE